MVSYGPARNISLLTEIEYQDYEMNWNELRENPQSLDRLRAVCFSKRGNRLDIRDEY